MAVRGRIMRAVEDGGIKDDKMVKAERELKPKLVAQAREIMESLAQCITEENAPRALRLIESTAAMQRELLSELSLAGLGPKPLRRRSLGEGYLTDDDQDGPTH